MADVGERTTYGAAAWADGPLPASALSLSGDAAAPGRSSPAPVRVVSLVTNLYVGGDANRLLHFARAVDRARIDHRLLLLVSPDQAQDQRFGPMLPRFLAHGVRVDSLAEQPRAARVRGRSRLLTAWRDLCDLRRITARVAEYLQAHDVDVVDARMDHAILVGVSAALRAGARVVGTEYGPEFWQTPARYAIGQFVFRRLDALIVDSAHKRDVYRRWLLGKKPPIAVIQNGIHEPTAQRSREEMRAALGLPLDPCVRVVAQISRVVPYKGHRVLLHAAARLFAKVPDVVLLICGFAHPESYGADLVALAEQLGIASRVRFVGWSGDISEVWRAVDVHVHASEFDSSPIALHESMALGLPAVTTDAGGIPELVVDGETGLVAKAGDAPALASALLRVLTDAALAQRLGQAARARYVARHTAPVMAETLTALFEGLAAQRRARLREAGHAGAIR